MDKNSAIQTLLSHHALTTTQQPLSMSESKESHLKLNQLHLAIELVEYVVSSCSLNDLISLASTSKYLNACIKTCRLPHISLNYYDLSEQTWTQLADVLLLHYRGIRGLSIEHSNVDDTSLKKLLTLPRLKTVSIRKCWKLRDFNDYNKNEIFSKLDHFTATGLVPKANECSLSIITSHLTLRSLCLESIDQDNFTHLETSFGDSRILNQGYIFEQLTCLCLINSPCIVDLAFTKHLQNLTCLFLGGSHVLHALSDAIPTLLTHGVPLKLLEVTYHDPTEVQLLQENCGHFLEIWDFSNLTHSDVQHAVNCLGPVVLNGAGSAVNCHNRWKQTPLHVAVLAEDSASCELLLTLGSDVFSTDGKGCTALHRAATIGFASGVTQMLNHLPQQAQKDQLLTTYNHRREIALYIACLKSHVSTAQLLLRAAGPSPDDPARVYGHLKLYHDGWTPAAAACVAGNAVLLESLIAAGGFLLDASNTTGLTPVHIAARRGFVEGVRLLLNAGVNLKNGSPIGLIKPRENAQEIGQLLRQAALEQKVMIRTSKQNKKKKKLREKKVKQKKNFSSPEETLTDQDSKALIKHNVSDEKELENTTQGQGQVQGQGNSRGRGRGHHGHQGHRNGRSGRGRGRNKGGSVKHHKPKFTGKQKET